MKEVLANKINRKRPLGRPRTWWVAQDIKNIKEESTFDDSYEKENWRGWMMVEMAIDMPTTWGRRRITNFTF